MTDPRTRSSKWHNIHNQKKWTEIAEKEMKGKSVETLSWMTPEGIKVKPLYTAEDLEGMESANTLEGKGIDKIWATILDHRDKLTTSGEMAEKRKTQALDWMAFLLDEGLRQWFYTGLYVREALPTLRDVEEQKISPTAAADTLLAFLNTQNG